MQRTRDESTPPVADREAKTRSAAIDRQLRSDKKRRRRELQLLMLGDGADCEQIFREINLHCYGEALTLVAEVDTAQGDVRKARPRPPGQRKFPSDTGHYCFHVINPG